MQHLQTKEGVGVLWLTRHPGKIISPDAHVMTRGHPAMADSDSTSISAVTARCVTLGRAELELINYPRTRNFCVWPPLLLQSSGKRITYPNFRASAEECVTSSDKFDLIVIGCGPAGEKGGAQAAYFGKRVAVIERAEHMGGSCINTGTVPSKTLRESALY